MYIESQPGQMSFAEQHIRGSSGMASGFGAVTAMSLAAAAGDPAGAASPAQSAPAPAAPPLVMAPMMRPVHDSKMPYVAAGIAVLGLAFLIYKATQE